MQKSALQFQYANFSKGIYLNFVKLQTKVFKIYIKY